MLLASSTQIKSSLQSTLIDSQRLAVKTLSLFAGTCILVVGSSIFGVCARTFSVGVGALVMGTLAVGTLVTGTLAVSIHWLWGYWLWVHWLWVYWPCVHWL